MTEIVFDRDELKACLGAYEIKIEYLMRVVREQDKAINEFRAKTVDEFGFYKGTSISEKGINLNQ